MQLFRQWAPELKFLTTLADLDEEIAWQITQTRRCAHCGGQLHRSDTPRSTRGISGSARELFGWRVSFCCAARECRKRYTPPSLRFPERKWYALGVMLVAAVLGPRNQEHVTGRVMVAGAAVPLRTVRRWQVFFRTEFAVSPTWLWLRARIPGFSDGSRDVPGSLFRWAEGGRSEPSAAHWLGSAITLLVHAAFGSRNTESDAAIAIRRVWHCRAPEAAR